jgi:hypothetical protein
MTITTAEFQNKPDFYNSQQECLAESKNYEGVMNTNPRYKHFTQNNFTAGDEEQFQTYRDETNGNLCIPNISLNNNLFKEQKFPEWSKYKDVKATAVINTFRYIFHKFKKGIFVKIVNNNLRVFLPFSKVHFNNEWAARMKVDPSKYSNINDFLKFVAEQGGYKFRPYTVNQIIEEWYGNNCLIRSDLSKDNQTGKFFPTEGDSNVGNVKNMLETLCANRKVPDIELFINRRDFPVITRDGTEPYNNIWDGTNIPLISHNYQKYIPILSMATADRYADIAIPTWEDWTRVQTLNNIWFPDSCRDYNEDFNKDWDTKIPTAVFRGASTGCGVTIETNMRLKLSYLSYTTPPDEEGIPYLNAGITKWQLRPRKIQGEQYLQTIDINTLPFGLVDKLTPIEQSNYKYIVNVDGNVSAFRLSLELNMGSVILLVDSPWKIWYRDMLKPYTHYVPVKEDLSNLIDQIKWCRKNDGRCQEIVKNAQQFFNKYLQFDGILDYMQKTIVDIKNEIGVYVYNVPNVLETQINYELNSLTTEYPETEKTINDINFIPISSRCYGLFRGVQWIVNMILSSDTYFEDFAQKTTHIFNNKLSSIDGYMLAGFPFAVKSTTNKEKIKEHIHEAFIGINCINELTKYIPNFIYTFGIYKKDNTYNVINEYIHGESLHSYIQNKDHFNFEEFLLILIQIALAIQVAQNHCGFIHWDLTPWNIILQRTEEIQQFDYVLDDQNTLRVKTKIIPVIIDYGKSHVIHEGQHHGFINMFSVSSIQDVLSILITSVDSIRNSQRLNSNDFHYLLYLVNFITNTQYRKNKFTSAQELRSFTTKAKRYTSLISDNKYELEQLTPLDLIRYIYKLKNYKNISKSVGKPKDKIHNIMEKSNSRQVFEFILSSTPEEQLQTYVNVYSRLKRCSLPLPSNIFCLYYAIQSLEDNLVSNRENMLYFIDYLNIDNTKYEKIFESTMRFLKKVYQEKINSLKNTPIKYEISDNFSTLELAKYTEETFLEPESILQLLRENNQEFTNLNDYKEIIESVLNNGGSYQLTTEEKEYYRNIFNKLLTTNSFNMICNSANYKTLRTLSLQLYTQNINELHGSDQEGNCEDFSKYLKKYKDIIQVIENN